MMSEEQLAAVLHADGHLATERLDHWAKTSGSRTFLYYGEDDVSVTYAEAARRTDSIAGNLAASGIEKGDRVTVFCTNPVISVLLMYGIWKAGALYCPVNIAYSGRLLTYQLGDTAPQLVITDAQLLPALNDVLGGLATPPRVCVYEAPAGAHDHVATRVPVNAAVRELAWTTLTSDRPAPGVVITIEDPANVVYTSGTTGAAKGVVQPHRWMAQYIFAVRLMLTQDDVIYNDLPMYHVGGAIANVVRAGWAGCEVAMWDRFSPTDFWRRVALRKATAGVLIDVMIPWLMKAPPQPDDRDNTLNKAHMQPLPLHHHAFAKRFGIDFVTTGFGQTEVGVPLMMIIEETLQEEGTPERSYRGHTHAEMHELARRFGMLISPGATVTRKGCMGRPGLFVEVSVRNARDEECAVEEAGQLAFRPKLPHLFLQEYLGKPQATLAAFRNLWFHTGDAALEGEDGLYYFVDRLGDRMRVRGENLSSFEVEDLINQHPSVQFTAVIAMPSAEGDEDDVVAFVVAVPGATLSEDVIHRFALETMPKHMRPRHVRVLADLPRTPTNKVEKYRLRQQFEAELAAKEG